eukprot:12842806-Alexandrium_andersonii.AAC.1
MSADPVCSRGPGAAAPSPQRRQLAALRPYLGSESARSSAAPSRQSARTRGGARNQPRLQG